LPRQLVLLLLCSWPRRVPSFCSGLVALKVGCLEGVNYCKHGHSVQASARIVHDRTVAGIRALPVSTRMLAGPSARSAACRGRSTSWSRRCCRRGGAAWWPAAAGTLDLRARVQSAQKPQQRRGSASAATRTAPRPGAARAPRWTASRATTAGPNAGRTVRTTRAGPARARRASAQRSPNTRHHRSHGQLQIARKHSRQLGGRLRQCQTPQRHESPIPRLRESQRPRWPRHQT